MGSSRSYNRMPKPILLTSDAGLWSHKTAFFTSQNAQICIWRPGSPDPLAAIRAGKGGKGEMERGDGKGIGRGRKGKGGERRGGKGRGKGGRGGTAPSQFLRRVAAPVPIGSIFFLRGTRRYSLQ